VSKVDSSGKVEIVAFRVRFIAPVRIGDTDIQSYNSAKQANWHCAPRPHGLVFTSKDDRTETIVPYANVAYYDADRRD
jgi:hypothetical protein